MRASLPAILLLAAALSPAADPTAINLQQVAVDLPSITVYVDVLDEKSVPITGLKREDFSASVAGLTLPFAAVTPFSATKEGIAAAILIDTSASIPRNRFQDMVAAAGRWIETMGPKDRTALVAIGSQYDLVQPLTADKIELISALKSLKTREEKTALYFSLRKALEYMQSGSSAPARRVLLVMTDGMDDDDTTGIREADVVATAEQTHIPIFALGVTANPQHATGDRYLKALAGLALRGNGTYAALGAANTTAEGLADQLRDEVSRVYVGQVPCAKCPRDGRPYPLTVKVKGFTGTPTPVILWSSAPPIPWYTRYWWTLVLGAVVLIAAVAIAIVAARRKTIPPPAPEPPPLPPPLPEPIPPKVETWTPPRPPPPGVRGVKLAFVDIGKSNRYEAELVERVVLGKDSQNAVCVLGDDLVGDRQCEFYRQDGGVFVRNLNTARPTLVNGVPVVAARRIEHRDLMVVGSTEMRLLIGDVQ